MVSRLSNSSLRSASCAAACAAACAALVACEGASTGDVPSRGQGESRSTGSAEHTVIERAALWPDTATLDTSAARALSPSVQRDLEASTVPVLAPRGGAWASAARVVVRPAFTSLVARAGGAQLFVSATRPMHRYAHLEEAARAAVAHPAKQRLRGTHGWVTQNEGVWSATWEEHGVTYVAEFLCDDPSEARCATADALLAEIESLAYVGGQGGAR